MFQGLIHHLKGRLDIALKSAACGVIAVTAVVIAAAFFCAAGFVALAARFGTIDTCLMFGGGFVVIGAVAATVLMVMRRRAARSKLNLDLKRAFVGQAFADPQTIALGAEIIRLLGGRRAASMGLVGAFIIGVLLSRSVPRK